MEILHDADFLKELKSSPRPAYLFFGEEDYLKSAALRSARDLICPDPTFACFNDLRLDALDFSPDRLADALMPIPMMADRKLVTLTGLNFNALRPGDLDALCDAIASSRDYDYNLLLVVASADALDPGYLPKKPSALLTKLSAVLVPVLFEAPRPSRLSGWVARHFAHNGVSASPAFCSAMVDYCGHDLFTLSGEIDKLSWFVLSNGRTEPTSDDLAQVCTPALEYDSFSFANAIMDGQRERALAILSDYKRRRVEPVSILAEVIRVFCDMESVRSLSRAGLPAPAIASALKIHEFRVGLYQKALASISDATLHRAIDSCASADSALKLSPQGYLPIEQLICGL